MRKTHFLGVSTHMLILSFFFFSRQGTGSSGSCAGKSGLLPGNYCAPMLRCRAKYAYKAARSDELSFEKGDMIIVKKQGKNWWLGSLTKGNQTFVGAFPISYTELLQPGQ